MTKHARRFPRPWTVEEYDHSCFIIRDNSRTALAAIISPRRRLRAGTISRRMLYLIVDGGTSPALQGSRLVE
jgi:hypothetical protein